MRPYHKFFYRLLSIVVLISGMIYGNRLHRGLFEALNGGFGYVFAEPVISSDAAAHTMAQFERFRTFAFMLAAVCAVIMVLLRIKLDRPLILWLIPMLPLFGAGIFAYYLTFAGILAGIRPFVFKMALCCANVMAVPFIFSENIGGYTVKR